ncbi:MAG: hypothetical protein WD557_13310 [Dehalococcoidia bacterium]
MGNSTDMDSNVPERERSAWLSAAVFASETGVDPQLTVRTIWPSKRLPGLVEGWLGEHEPEVVFFMVNAFWFTYPSVPLRLRRLLGPVGKAVSDFGLRVGGNPTFTRRRLFQLARRWTVRAIGGDTHFTPESVLSTVEACLRAIVVREDIVLVVRGPLASHGVEIGGRMERRSNDAWRQVDGGLRRLCASLHVEYGGLDDPMDTRGSLSAADLVHPDAAGHQYRAELEGMLMVRGWERVHGRATMGQSHR